MAFETPPPHPHHARFIELVAPNIEANMAKAGRGLVVARLKEGGREILDVGVTPAKNVDLAYAVSTGIPETAAAHVVDTVRTYDDLVGIPVLVTEGPIGEGFLYSFVMLDVRPLPPKGTNETKH